MITGAIEVLRPAAQNVPPGVSLPAGPEGPKGDQGAPGLPGTNGTNGVNGLGLIGTRIASVAIPASTVVVDLGDGTCAIADPSNAAHLGKVLGLVSAAILAQASASYQVLGPVAGVSGTFGANDRLWIGDGTTGRLGSLVNVAPGSTTAAWRQSVGTASSSIAVVLALGVAYPLQRSGTPLVAASGGFAPKATPTQAAAGTPNVWLDPATVGVAAVTPDDGIVSLSLSTAIAARAPKASPTFTGTATHADTVQTPNQAVPITLSGQPTGILAARFMQTARKVATLGSMLFLDVVELTDAIGAAASGVAQTTVAFYRAAIGLAGGGAMYAANLLTESHAGHTGKVAVLEANLNIDPNGTTSGSVPAQFLSDPTKQPNCYIVCIGAVQKPISYVYGWNGLGGLNQAYTGINFHNGTIQGPVLDDYTTSTHVVRAAGAKTTGFDVSGCTFTSGLAHYLGNGHKIGWADASGVASAAQINALAGNLILAGGGVFVEAPLIPSTDNAYSVGTGAARFATGYFANGVASSSNADLKTDIAALDGGTAVALVQAIDAMKWRWKVGGVDLVDGTEEVEEHAYTTAADGTKTYLFDATPAVDATGKPILEAVTLKGATTERQRIDVVPRMVKATRPCKVAQTRAGKRVHVGWLYQDVQAALAKLALDLGILDATANGDLFLRPERMTAVLWAAWRHRDAEIETRLDALEGTRKASA